MMRSLSPARALVRAGALALVLAAPPLAHAQKLGTISFPNSGAPAAQAPFIRGMLLMHSFEYRDALAAFREAQKADPSFALAYVGEALAYTHPVWSQQDSTAARAVLARLAPTPAARRAKAPTHREQMYLDAVEALYGAGSKAKRDTLYAEAIARIVDAHPEDDEAKVLYALALLGLNQSVRDVPTYMRAGAIAEDVLRRNPQHPGAAHFVIHAFDDPTHAPLGLWAARAYSAIAPEAPHAQHMTTHIFLALGMWDEVVSQNVIASGPNPAGWRPGHYTSWLLYGYLQQGKYTEAGALLARLRANAGDTAGRDRGAVAYMRAAYLLNSERWSDSATAWSLGPFQRPMARALDDFALAYAALKRGERARAEQTLAELERQHGGRGASVAGAAPTEIRILIGELRAALLSAAGKHDEAIAEIRAAARLEDEMPVEFGPPQIVKPTHELAGEILLAAGRAAEAQREFTQALAMAPGRARALVGLARAASKTGDTAVAARAARELLRAWHAADAGLAEQVEVRRLVSASTAH